MWSPFPETRTTPMTVATAPRLITVGHSPDPDDRYDAGLIIHEGQLTYQNQGLHLVVDLGVWWQDKTGLPLPLGGNVVRRDLGEATIKEVSRLLKESIQYGLAHR